MAFLKNIEIKNLRSLRSVGEVPIAPITILLGKNSVGKSTFARVFPLLRQSVESKKRSPILWFGDYVDFGSFEQAISRGEKEISIGFDFDISHDYEKILPWASKIFQEQTFRVGSERNFSIESARVVLTLAVGDAVYAKKLLIKTLDLTIELNLNESNKFKELIVNGEKVKIPENGKIIVQQGSVLPSLSFLVERKLGNQTYLFRSPQILNKIDEELKPAVTKALSKFSFVSVEGLSASLSKSRVKKPDNFESMLDYAIYLQRYFVINNCFGLIDLIDENLKDYFSSVKYLKPLRATAERYYRRQDLSVQEIDAEGRNLPMFLDSLTQTQLNDFQDWLKPVLGLSVSAQREGGQIMVVAQTDEDAEPYNIADMGFGISQVLPIAAQLWMVQKPRANKKVPVVIEQPELHLHPDYQARLADLFVASLGVNKNARNSLIIETHSPHIVNRLGELIENGKLKREDVVILLFETMDDESKSVRIRVSDFDDEGVLQNWPFGFFEPEMNNVD